ncbi:uncharacterized protein METZ01_LOCUS247603 [marine metagenome]|uniref:Pyridoxamine 5'-phosphate oxidase N-terminal domain-containing protein n=1 Tax=marine metagenome TaxID=408172 RepID=A0A382I668_9ZZZZ|tara:strand:+ start:713 stop:1138 length:426 start_codon:yes stop_codon:yes gene_type:complete
METLQKFILEHNTMTLATVGNKVASAAAVFYAPIKNNTSLIFVSSPESEHILNCKMEPHCAVTIQDDGLRWEIIKGAQLKGEVYVADKKYWMNYFEKYPYIKSDETLSKALEKVKLYEFKIKWIRMIDNSKGFGNREEYNL